jgi:lipoic acid synthetase
MILGNICTRNCRFCGVDKGNPLPPDSDEPRRIAQAVKKLGLNYVVITSVTRDDIPDGGASHFARVIRALREIRVEVLIPDFQGNQASLEKVLNANPYVINHNLETVPRLYPRIRPQADYKRSLGVFSRINAKNRRACPERNQGVYTKSGFMVGLGEKKEEIISVLEDLRSVECDIVTIGQYLPPSKVHPQVERYVPPEEFEEYREIGKDLGFLKVFSGPFVRSSYCAGEII